MIWPWLNSNAGALQSLAALLNVALAVATIGILIVTWRAIKRQASAAEDQTRAARALTKVAEDQTKAAEEAAKYAHKQSDLLSAQIEQSTAPLLVAEPDDRPGYNNYKLCNRGAGVAFKIFYWRGGIEVKQQGTGIPFTPVTPSTLGAGNFAYLPIPPAWDVFTVVYKGQDRQFRWTVVYRDPGKAQEHIVSQGLQEIYLS